MLSRFISKKDCAECRFCCSFRRQSLWETPVIYGNEKRTLEKLYPSAVFKKADSSQDSWTVDLSGCYKTDSDNEEAPCPFLDPQKGCMLPQELKPFDCKIWPLRVVKTQDGSLAVKLTPTCPAMNKIPLKEIRAFLTDEVKETILKQARLHPEMVKENSSFFVDL